MPEPPRYILIRDLDDGYIKAEWVDSKENAGEEIVEIYSWVEYYHDLESALKDM